MSRSPKKELLMELTERLVTLSNDIIADIMRYTTYFDTITLLSILKDGDMKNEGKLSNLYREIQGERIWQVKAEIESLSRENKAKMKSESWQDFYMTNTEKLGARLVGLGDFDLIVNKFLVGDDVAWILTSDGSIFSCLLRDTDIIWTLSDSPNKFISMLPTADDYTVIGITDSDIIRTLKAGNRAQSIVYKNFEELEVNDRNRFKKPSTVGKTRINYVIQRRDGKKIIVTLMAADERFNSELPEADITTLTVETPVTPIGDIQFDRSTQNDIVSEFVDTDFGMINGINTV